MADDDLDSIVKGAPVAAKTLAAARPGDPLSHAPSSPSMVYLNLLILEASLRAQFLELRARRRHHTFFLALLTLWVAVFGYELYFAPREDGRGVGGSIYWAVEGAQRVCFMGGIITAVLVWATGIWDRGIRWPRRWFAISNRGLRAFNCKLVLIRRPWWAEALSTAAFFLTYGLFSHTASSSYRRVDPALLRETETELRLAPDSHPTLVLPHDAVAAAAAAAAHEEDLAPGGDYVKLLLLPKPFSPTFRENWELYRSEYWERENERRALLRRKVKQHERRLAKQMHGWLWWLPWRQVEPPRQPDHHQPQSPHHHHLKTHATRQSISEKGRKRRGSSASLRRPSITSSSRSPTPSLEVDDAARRPSAASDKRRRKPPSGSRPRRPGTESRSVTPEIPSPLVRESGAAADLLPADPGGRALRSSSAKAGDGGSPAKEKHESEK